MSRTNTHVLQGFWGLVEKKNGSRACQRPNHAMVGMEKSCRLMRRRSWWKKSWSLTRWLASRPNLVSKKAPKHLPKTPPKTPKTWDVCVQKKRWKKGPKSPPLTLDPVFLTPKPVYLMSRGGILAIFWPFFPSSKIAVRTPKMAPKWLQHRRVRFCA